LPGVARNVAPQNDRHIRPPGARHAAFRGESHAALPCDERGAASDSPAKIAFAKRVPGDFNGGSSRGHKMDGEG